MLKSTFEITNYFCEGAILGEGGFGVVRSAKRQFNPKDGDPKIEASLASVPEKVNSCC